jgi:Ser/Thr protein kinase RdoA (MazF antagonist)
VQSAVADVTDATFPVVHSVIAADALRPFFSLAYGFDRHLRCDLLLAGMNDTYLLRTVDGRRYVARVYPAGSRSKSEVLFELELVLHLAREGVNVAAAVATLDGEYVLPLTTCEGTRHVAVFDYVRGAPLAWTDPRHCYAAGRLLARLHDASEGFRGSGSRAPLDADYLIDRPLAAIAPFLSSRPADAAYLEAFAARLRQRLATIAPELQWGVCHGDFSSTGNFHVTEDMTVTVFDFDLCGPGWRIYDLAPVRRAAVGHKNRRIWREFLRGYTDARWLSSADLAAVPVFYVIARFWSIGMRASGVKRWGTVFMADWYLDWQLNVFRQWEAKHG